LLSVAQRCSVLISVAQRCSELLSIAQRCNSNCFVRQRKLSFESLINLVKPGHCMQLSSNISNIPLSCLYAEHKKTVSVLKMKKPAEFILSEFSRRTYMTMPKQILNSDHQFRVLKQRIANKYEYEIKSRRKCWKLKADYYWQPRELVQKLSVFLSRIWPTMKIHTDTDSTNLNFSHFSAIHSRPPTLRKTYMATVN